MRRHLRTSRVQTPPAGQSMPTTSWKLTLILAVMAGISIGAALRLVRDERIIREKAAEGPEAVFRYPDPQSESKRAVEPAIQQERARYETFEESMGLRETAKGLQFTF